MIDKRQPARQARLCYLKTGRQSDTEPAAATNPDVRDVGCRAGDSLSAGLIFVFSCSAPVVRTIIMTPGVDDRIVMVVASWSAEPDGTLPSIELSSLWLRERNNCHHHHHIL
jgi:hypothetical protein